MSLNLILGIVGSVVALLLISNKRFPAALVIVVVGLIIGAVYSEFNAVPLAFGPTEIRFSWPTADNFLVAITLLVIPQIPLTVGNAIIGTHETCIALFDSEMTGRVSNQNLTLSMGLANLVIGLVGGVPLCHGAGGMAAHYRFGARSGGSNIMIGAIFIFIALAFGTIGIALLSALPNAVLGILLLFAGLELAMLVRDLTTKADLFVTVLIASLGFITTNMSVAFVIGIAVSLLIRFARIKL